MSIRNQSPKRSRRHRPRGAVFVEALVVISVFILFLLGILFFRELYLKKLSTMRLARAGAMAHAMAACKPDIGAILRDDIPASSKASRRSTTEPLLTERAKAPESKADNIFDKMDDGSGGTPLNEVNDVGLSSSASATSKPSPFEAEIGFRGDVTSNSYVSCGDELQTEQYGAIAPFIASQIYK